MSSRRNTFSIDVLQYHFVILEGLAALLATIASAWQLSTMPFDGRGQPKIPGGLRMLSATSSISRNPISIKVLKG